MLKLNNKIKIHKGFLSKFFAKKKHSKLDEKALLRQINALKKKNQNLLARVEILINTQNQLRERIKSKTAIANDKFTTHTPPNENHLSLLSSIKNCFKRYKKKILKFDKKIGKFNEQSENPAVFKKRIEALLKNQEILRKKISQNGAVNRYLNFAQLCQTMALKLKADVYIGHGIHSLPAVDVLARTAGGKKFNDVIEIPSFFDRLLVPSWPISNLVFLDNAFETYLRKFDGLLTVGWALKDQIKHFGTPVTVIPNYRYSQELNPSNVLREKCNLGKEEKIILSLSTVTAGLEAVIESLTFLKETAHLVIVGDIKPSSYEDKIRSLIQELHLENRVHFFPKIEYSQLTSFISAANVGLIIRDPNILNNKISLPNRIFDYVFSGIPVCSPNIKDIATIIKTYKAGAIVKELTPEGWFNAIESVLSKNEKMKANAIQASKELIWEKVEDKLYKALGHPKKVTYISIVNLKENNRTMRMAASLVKKGVEVIICYPSKEKPYIENGIQFIPTVPC
ncbi:glycosyltransferase [Legionella sp. CNM-1927-20]|uniref:glycosyltransferase n=1 Tax=Legionella sp. CNM-1927-20 TaxID=3422221 RepID=UPI00403A9623